MPIFYVLMYPQIEKYKRVGTVWATCDPLDINDQSFGYFAS